MNDEIPVELQDIDFQELTNNQQNIWKLKDELNATRRWIRENAVSPETLAQEEAIQKINHAVFGDSCTHENSYQMKPGLMRCKDCKKIYKVAV